MTSHSQSGPAWLGIGAQRAGTTWLTDLLTQHPKVGLGVGHYKGVVRKEHHALHKVAEGLEDHARYRDRFQGAPGEYIGEWTPYYLTALNVPAAAVAVTDESVPFFVALRDPIERYASSMRLWVVRPKTRTRLAPQLAQAQWSGMYADQLDAWARIAGRDRLVVMVFEEAAKEPQPACDRMWRAMGLEPRQLKKAEKTSSRALRRAGPTHAAASEAEWRWPPGLKEELTRLYNPQVRRLRDDWGLDVSLWPNFADLA